MTYSVKTFEFTAFTEADLLQGVNGGSIGCGDTFTMPTSATTCFTVKDNDRYLSGDKYRDEKGDDSSYQTADIEVNGTQVYDDAKIYAEQYHVLKGSDGKWYYLIEIEVKNGDAPGAGDDFFTFYGNVPPAGVSLTVKNTCNVTSDWVDFKCLDAGPKEEPNGWLTGRLTYDADCNDNEWNDDTGTWDEGVEGQTVLLLDLDGNVVDTAITDSYGTYTFDVPAGDYRVKFPKPDGYKFSAKDSGVDDHFDSDADEDGLTDVVTVWSGEKTKNVDAGLKPAEGSVTGTVFCDIDCDGIQDAGECVLGPNLIVNGDFEHNSLNDMGWGSGVLKSGWYDVGSKKAQVHEQDYGHGNATGDAIVELEYGVILCQIVNISEDCVYRLSFDVTRRGHSDQDNTFSLFIDGVRYDTFVVTEDRTIEIDLDLDVGDHRFDFKSESHTYIGAGLDDVKLQKKTVTDGEPGKEGVVVMLLDADGNPVLDDDGEMITTVTDADGNYRFDDLPEGDYRVKFTAPDGMEFTLQNVGDDDTIDSDVGDDGISDVFQIVAGDTTEDVDAGLKDEPTASLEGRYFCDENNNDLDDNNGDEPGVNGILVTLINLADNSVVDTMTTGEIDGVQGAYRFEGLEAGEYKVVFAADPTGKTFVAQTPGNNDSVGGSDVDPSNGETGPIVLADGENRKDVDAGVEDPGTAALRGRVFCDENDDSLDNNGEEGVGGVLVTLLDENGDPTGLTMLTSDVDGTYEFTGLDAGTYFVRFGEVPDKALVTQDVDGDVSDDIDSDANETTRETGAIVLEIGEISEDNDAGVEAVNDDPEPMNDVGALCADDMIVIDVLGNDSDPNGDTLTIASVSVDAGADLTYGTDDDVVEALIDGGPAVTLESGAQVSLIGGELKYNLMEDGDDFDSLLIGDTAMDQFAYQVEDGNGGSAAALVDVTVKGALNTIDTIAASFKDDMGNAHEATYRIDIDFSIFEQVVTVMSTDERLGGDGVNPGMLTFPQAGDLAYCVDQEGDIIFGADVLSEVCVADENDAGLADAVQFYENLDIVTWILNQGFQSIDNGTYDMGGPTTTGDTYSFEEVQDAIWFFTDNFVDDGMGGADTSGLSGNVKEIADQAAMNGEGFVAGSGDIVGLVFDPIQADLQTYIIGVPFDDLAQDCECL